MEALGTKVLVITFLFVLLLVGALASFQPAEAKKASGKKLLDTNSKLVCGDALCEEPMTIEEKIAAFLFSLTGEKATAMKPISKIAEMMKQVKQKTTQPPPVTQTQPPTPEEPRGTTASPDTTASIMQTRVGEPVALPPIQLPSPYRVAVNEVTNRIYILYDVYNNPIIAVIDGVNNTIIKKTIGLPYGGRNIVVNSELNLVYVPNSWGGITVINGSTNQIIKENIEIGSSFTFFDVASDGRIFVAADDDLLTVDPNTYLVSPCQLLEYDGRDLLILGDAIFIFDRSQSITKVGFDCIEKARIPIHSAEMKAKNPLTGRFYIGYPAEAAVTRLSVITENLGVLKKSYIAGHSAAIDVNTKLDWLYLAIVTPESGYGFSVHIYDGKVYNLINKFVVGSEGVHISPRDIAVNPNFNRVYIIFEEGDKVLVYDVASS